MTTVFHAWSYGKLIEIQSNLRRYKHHKTSQQNDLRAPIQFKRESQPQNLKKIIFPQEQNHPFPHK